MHITSYLSIVISKTLCCIHRFTPLPSIVTDCPMHMCMYACGN